jgi:hypothetical protein
VERDRRETVRAAAGAAARGLGLALALLLATAPARTAAATGEYEVKAAFLLNFARLIEWPDASFAGPDSPLCIALWGADPFAGSLDALVKSENVSGRPIRTRRVASPAEARGCQLLFVPASQTATFRSVQGELAATPVVVVGEQAGFASDGGAIGFYEEEGRIRFEVNRRIAEGSGAKLSSRLLRLARIVEE